MLPLANLGGVKFDAGSAFTSAIFYVTVNTIIFSDENKEYNAVRITL